MVFALTFRKEKQMTNEEFEIAFKQAIANVGDYSNMILYNLKNPTIYVTKEHYEMIKKRKGDK